VGSLFTSLLIGVLVAGAVFVVSDKLRSRIDARGAAFVGAASNLFEGRGLEIAGGISVLTFLFCVAWHDYPLFKAPFSVLNGNASAVEEQDGSPVNAGYAFGGGSAASPSISGVGQQYSSTTASGGGSEIINRTDPGYAIGFWNNRWRGPAERHLPEFGNRWTGERRSGGGVAWRPPAVSVPTVVSRPMVASRPRR
jgi:hypothetical protein